MCFRASKADSSLQRVRDVFQSHLIRSVAGLPLSHLNMRFFEPISDGSEQLVVGSHAGRYDPTFKDESTITRKSRNGWTEGPVRQP
jgi:hypothetical protein